jgi:hypothetical protein
VSFVDFGREETVVLSSLQRVYELRVGTEVRQSAPPFHVTATLGFRWDPFQAARSHGCEEDLLTELFGRRSRVPRTLPRWERLDVIFRAALPWNSKVTIPDRRLWPAWTARVRSLLSELVPIESVENRSGHPIAVGWRGDVELRETCASDGTLVLDRVEVPAWQIVNPPRAWSDPAKLDRGLGRQLDQLACRFATAFDLWMNLVTELSSNLRMPPGGTTR